jgi:hypothetical protein
VAVVVPVWVAAVSVVPVCVAAVSVVPVWVVPVAGGDDNKDNSKGSNKGSNKGGSNDNNHRNSMDMDNNNMESMGRCNDMDGVADGIAY